MIEERLPPWAGSLLKFAPLNLFPVKDSNFNADRSTDKNDQDKNDQDKFNCPAWLNALPYTDLLEDEIEQILRSEFAVKKTILSLKKIPTLKSRKIISDSQYYSLSFAAAYNQMLAYKKHSVLTGDDFDTLWSALNSNVTLPALGKNGPNATNKPAAAPAASAIFNSSAGKTRSPSPAGDEQNARAGTPKRIGLYNFLKLGSSLSSKFARYFQPSIFLTLGPDSESNTVSIEQFFGYVLRRSSLLNARLDFAFYDGDMDGHLNEDELQAYLADLLPALNFSSLKPSFYKFYLCTASRKFFFYLDPLHRNRIAIRDLILSPYLTELFLLRETDIPRELERSNWFSANSAMRVYTQFMTLDTDRNGMLSQAELAKYANGALCSSYISRVFQECQTYNGEMDYRTYLDFALANEALPFSPNYHPSSIAPVAELCGDSGDLGDTAGIVNQTTLAPAVLNFHFKLLDIDSKGYLSVSDLYYFVKDLTAKLTGWGLQTPPLEILVNEIIDIVNPEQPGTITIKDLSKPGVAGTVIGLLIDVNAFTSYENRESS